MPALTVTATTDDGVSSSVSLSYTVNAQDGNVEFAPTARFDSAVFDEATFG